MVARILLSTTGLKISRPGVSVLTAGRTDLAFTSDMPAIPVVETIRGYLHPTWGDAQAFYFQRTYPDRPLVSAYWGGETNPATVAVASQRLMALMMFSKVFAVPVVTMRSREISSSNYTTTWFRTYSNRIEVQNIKSNNGGTDMDPFSGYLTFVIHGFYD